MKETLDLFLLELLTILPSALERRKKAVRVALERGGGVELCTGVELTEQVSVQKDGSLILCARLGRVCAESRVFEQEWAFTPFEQLPVPTQSKVAILVTQMTPSAKGKASHWEGEFFGLVRVCGYRCTKTHIFSFVYNDEGPFEAPLEDAQVMAGRIMKRIALSSKRATP